MSTVQHLEKAAEEWAAAIFGNFERYRMTDVPSECLWLLASFGSPPQQLDFSDWTVDVLNRLATGGIVAVTDSHVIAVRLDKCPPEGATSAQLSAWIRPRHSIIALDLRPEKVMSTNRQSGCATVRFDDGVTLDLPLSNRADVPEMVRVLTPT